MINAERILLAAEEDIVFLIQQDQITRAQIERALAEAVILELVELRDAFERAKPLVLELVPR